MALRSPLTVQPYDYIGDSNGRPLDKGQIYIGVANQDPEFNQIPVYLDAGMTKLIDQPIRTNDGFVDFAGSLQELYTLPEVYSIKVLDKQGRKVLYKGDMTRKNLMSDALAELTQAVDETMAITTESINTIRYYAEYIDNVAEGKDGTDATIDFLPVETGAAGTPVVSVVSGTPSARTIALTIPKGDKGIDGKSAYQSALDNGFIGTEAEWKLYLKSDGSIQALQQFMTNTASTGVSVPDYGNIPSLQGYISNMFNNGGLPATPFKTKALMTASSLANDKYAMVTDDTVNNGLYVKTAGAWVKSGYDPLTQSKSYTDTAKSEAIMHSDTNKIDLVDISYTYTNGNMIGTKTPKYTNLGISGGIVAIASVDSLVLSVSAGDVLYMHNDTQKYTSALGSRFSFFADDPNINRTQSAITHTAVTETDTASGIIYQKVTVPIGAKYLMINTRTVTGGGTYNMTWAVHKGKFNPSFNAGTEVIYKIKDVLLGTDDYLRAATYTDAKLQDYDKLKISTKNLYNGTYASATKTNKLGVFTSANAGDCVTHFIPVTAGQSYTISGLDMSLQGVTTSLVVAFTGTSQATFVKYLAYLQSNGATTILIDDPTIKYIVVPITSDGLGTVAQAAAMPLQIEQGTKATTYQPYIYSPVAAKMLAGFSPAGSSAGSSAGSVAAPTVMLTNFIEMDKVRDAEVSTLGTIRKDVGSTGLRYILAGTPNVDSVSNNMFAQVPVNKVGACQLNVHVMKYAAGEKVLGTLKPAPFTVPSGQFDNPDTLTNYSTSYPLNSYVHPSIAYSATGIGGFKYWLMASTLPATNMGDSTWEDEDVFVSNDAKTWQRVRSLYENAKDYTTTTLTLPPHNLARANARKHAFLPCPSVGDTIEISVPADNGAPALERTNITLIALPWKHDPFIMFDGGYLYAYVSYHLPYVDRTSGKNRFIVCVRTSNGVDWDVVRSDGSTMRITEESSRTIFTKDAQGRYNYLAYFYSYGGSNPEVIKYGEGDYEFIYGSNFSRRYKGTAPYAFNFTEILPMQDVGSFNHPTLLLNTGTLYLLNHKALYASTDRGVTFTQYAKNPTWVGGVAAYDYKKTMCIGAEGKLIYVDTQRITTGNVLGLAGNFTSINNINLMSTYEYASLADFISKATVGLVDAYIDVQLTITNQVTGKRKLHFYPAVSLTKLSANVNDPLQRLTLGTLNFDAGDLATFYITLNSRNGPEIQFGGIDITQ